MPPAVFRPQLRSLIMCHIRGPLPDNMGRMVNLTSLEIQESYLTALPDSLGELRSLEVLDLRGLGLEALPASLSGLSRLRILHVSGNSLQSCPPLGALRRLRVVDLRDNYLTSLPEGILDLPLLERVHISYNRMYTLQWDVLKRLPLLGSDPMPDTYDPSHRGLEVALRMRITDGIGQEYVLAHVV